MSKYVIAALAAAALACCGYAVYQQAAAAALRVSLVETEADLADARAGLVVSEARRRGAESAHRETLMILADERAAADAAQDEIARLRDRIAKDAGTDRDAPTAPVLRDTIRGLTRTTFEGVTEVWTFVSVVAGRVEKVIEIPSESLCLALVNVAIADIFGRPEFEERLRGRVSLTCAPTAPRRSA
ncbi:hypothetical protein SAMN06297251_10126 [Fulvimarina manganoxydans]|uniref:Uncharacterized protein n=1 Tax=Fulvimarina manganoxydans TaxID=937218 RepID=A0A1W1Y8C2_9HYPH|nr:hypothetical protein [Fulvimarina manganoxydans]SMC32407.1 hypothetical protein SAMN06297251_10126 [Fulvimarina manganoxydans]